MGTGMQGGEPKKPHELSSEELYDIFNADLVVWYWCEYHETYHGGRKTFDLRDVITYAADWEVRTDMDTDAKYITQFETRQGMIYYAECRYQRFRLMHRRAWVTQRELMQHQHGNPFTVKRGGNGGGDDIPPFLSFLIPKDK